MPFHLIDAIQRYVAVTSVGASTVRGYPSGRTHAAREFLATIELRQLGVSRERVFQNRLDNLTEALRISLPPRAKHWGIARKLLNISLHNVFYKLLPAQALSARSGGALLEVPIDAAVAKGLRRGIPQGSLPRWPGLKCLKLTDHALFQQHASELAGQRSVSRVHLDAILWVQER